MEHATGESKEEIDTPDGVRSYLLHLPPSYKNRHAMPLVLSFHGYAQSAAQQEAYSALNPIADREGFIAVTPEGSGSPPGWTIPGTDEDSGVDDVAFARALMEHLGSTLCLDARRIYATGHSNGAEMAAQLACQLPGLIAAAAPVSGAIYQSCDGPGVPMVAFQGTADYNVPYEDSAAGIEGWVAHNGCPPEPEVSRLGEDIELRSWRCADGDVQFYVVEGGGHTWPGADPSLGGVGPATGEINASELMWAFFKAHPK